MIKLESKIIREILFFMRQHFKQPSTGARKLQNFLSPPFLSPPREPPQKNYSQYAAKQKIMNILRTTGRGLLTVQPGGGFLHR